MATKRWSSSQIAHLKAVFHEFDADNSGTVDTTELLNILRSAELGEVSAAEAQFLVERFDANKDGVLSWTEYLDMMELTEMRQLESIFDAFSVFDVDKSGTISTEEMQAVMARLGLVVSDPAAMLRFADKDGDGVVSFDEFAAIVGYRGPMYTRDELVIALEAEDAELRSLSVSRGGTDSPGSSSDSGSGSGSGSGSDSVSGSPVKSTSSLSVSSEVEVGDGEVLVRLVSFYLDERFHFALPRTAAMRTVADRVRRASGHGGGVRLYYRGLEVDVGPRSLAELGYDSATHTPIYIVYEHGDARADSSLVWEPDAPSVPRVFHILRHMLREGRLSNDDALALIQRAGALFHAESNLVTIETDEPLAVVGDIHGQLYDMLSLFDTAGDLGAVRYLFLGDYVDRGYFSAEVVLTLFAAKIRWPDRVHLLRGNHECEYVAERYGTKAEVEAKYSSRVWRAMTDAFSHMPLAALIVYRGRRFFACHGGLTADVLKLDDLERLNRHHRQIPRAGPLRELTWADPTGDVRAGVDAEKMPKAYSMSTLGSRTHKARTRYSTDTSFKTNGGSHAVLGYTLEALNAFLAANDLAGMFRGHEQVDKGADLGKFGPRYKFPGSTTIFSAPMYTDTSANIASVLVFEGDTAEFFTFGWRLHPQVVSFLPPKGGVASTGSGSKQSGSKQSGSKKSSSKQSGSKRSSSKQSSSKRSSSKRSSSKQSSSKRSSSKRSSSKQTSSKQSGSKYSGSKQSGSKYSGSKSSNKYSGGKQHNSSKHNGNKHNSSKHSSSGNKHTGSNHNGNKHNSSKHSSSGNKHTGSKHNGNKHGGLKHGRGGSGGINGIANRFLGRNNLRVNLFGNFGKRKSAQRGVKAAAPSARETTSPAAGQQKTFGHPPGTRLWEVEAIVQFVHHVNPDVLRLMTIHYVVAEFEAMFTSAITAAQRQDDGSRGWRFVGQNLTTVLRQSSDPAVLDRVRRKTELMAQWFRGHDFFAESLAKEAEFEKNVFSESAPSRDDSYNVHERAGATLSDADGEQTS